MALDMIPSEIRKYNGVCRMVDLDLVRKVKEAFLFSYANGE